MKKLIELLEVQSYSHDDSAMRIYLTDELAAIPNVEFYDDGDNIYATKGAGPYVCIVAHMDTVHRIQENLTAIVLNGRITGMNAVTMTQTGIGGDDKVGIYVALQMIKEHDNIKVFFPRDEEVGCLGSSLANPAFFDDVNFALQCDRRGNKDFITDAGGVELSGKEFQDAVFPILKQYGYRFKDGFMTDVMELKQNGINISMANMSCGYYNPHCANEYVDINDVVQVTTMVSQIITELGNTFFPHEAPMHYTYQDIDTAGDRETRWWEEKDPRRSIHSEPDFCNDCYGQPATKPDGLCDSCRVWYEDRKHLPGLKDSTSEVINISQKPDYGQSRVIIPTQSIKEYVQNFYGRKKKGKKKGR